MSVDSKHLVKVLFVETKNYISRATGQAGELKLAQCAITFASESGEKVLIGELLLPKHLSDTQPGEYLADFELGVDSQKRVISNLIALHPRNQSRPTSQKQSAV